MAKGNHNTERKKLDISFKNMTHFLLHANVNEAGVFTHVDVKNMSCSDRRLSHFSRERN